MTAAKSKDKPVRNGVRCGMCPKQIQIHLMMCSECKSLQDLFASAWRMYDRPSNRGFKSLS